MFTDVMKCVSMVVLALAVWGRSSPNYLLLLEFAVCTGAILVAVQAFRVRRHGWLAAFVLIALLYNPVYPVALDSWPAIAVDLTTVVAFLGSLFQLKPRPMEAMTSIRDRAA